MSTIMIPTSRFGNVEFKEEDLIHFPEGILGFSNLRQFVLLDDPNDEIFAWLQSCEIPQIAFPVLEPELFSAGYSLNLTKVDIENLGLIAPPKIVSAQSKAAAEPAPIQGLRAFSIITIPEDPTQMTANMKAPVVINIGKRIARQIVLQDNHLAIREPIFSKLQSRVVQNPGQPIKTQAAEWGVAIRLPKTNSQNPDTSAEV